MFVAEGFHVQRSEGFLGEQDSSVLGQGRGVSDEYSTNGICDDPA